MTTKKGKFLEEFNEAFLNGNMDYVVANVTDDIKWTVVGESPIQGKSDFARAFEMMESGGTQELRISNIITHGITAAVDGKVKVVDESGGVKLYAFCDIYRFNRFKDPKVKELTSYVMEVKE
ncbi:nuclear transport factor 2 family protein [Virgibacillus sp. JSM 102003]|uniref:nuclear transport factor 2 family protein n=1 Tax=Virgibacillus sp. JSM 102003 TaxID=1562108 RepID=UPI0035BFC185